MRRRVQTLEPFKLASDFSAPEPAEKDQITLSAAELAALLEDARRSTAELVRDETLSAHAEALNTLSSNLKQALGSVADLAQHLEKAAIDEHDRLMALRSIRHLAKVLVDGQGELFAKGAPCSQTGNHSGEQ